MAVTVYLLCALTSLACAALLVRAYLSSRTALLFWSALCFCGLFLNNLLLFIDLVIVPEVDLARLRTAAALVALALLVYGLVATSSRGGEAP